MNVPSEECCGRPCASRRRCPSLPRSRRRPRHPAALRASGGPSGYGLAQNCVHPNDDGSYSGPPPTTAPPHVDRHHPRLPQRGSQLLSARPTARCSSAPAATSPSAPRCPLHPRALPIADQPMIAPWWGDDRHPRRRQAPRATTSASTSRPNRVVVTWNNVGYFSAHDNLPNDFQLVLTTSNTCATTGDFDVEFRYNRCQWTTGDASGGVGGYGGTPSQVGFDANNRRNYVALPMSRLDVDPRRVAACPTCRAARRTSGASRSAAAALFSGGMGGTSCTIAGQRGARADRASTSAGHGHHCAAR